MLGSRRLAIVEKPERRTLASTGLAAAATEWAHQADALGRMHLSGVEAVLAAGFARHFVPGQWGGQGGTFTQLGRAVAEVGRVCGATAWIASLAAAAGRLAGYLPLEGQRDLWEAGSDVLLAASFIRAGAGDRVPGGWCLSGRWPFVTSAEAAEWVLLLSQCDDGPRFCAVPRQAYTVEETWANLGMKATGSHTVVVDRVVVPDHRSYLRDDLHNGTPQASTEGFHCVPHRAVTGLTFAGPLRGVAEGVLRESVDGTRKHLDDLGRTSGSLTSTHRLALARGSAEIKAAARILDSLERAADHLELGTDLKAAQAARDCAFAAEMLYSGADRLVQAAGTRALIPGQPMERLWRDARTAASHAALRFLDKGEAYAELLLSSPDHGTPPAAEQRVGS
jgi:two-component flavin-dependent monooxygenase